MPKRLVPELPAIVAVRTQPTISLNQASELLNQRPETTSRQITKKTFPFPTIKAGRTQKVPSAAVRDLLGIED
jgi:hypothetical protein